MNEAAMTALAEPCTKVSLADAYAASTRFARTRTENFPVVSLLVPARLRPHMFALYAFCRWTDDLGDEAEGDRVALLEDWRSDLLRCYDGQPRHHILTALKDTIERFDIPAQPFLDLIEANRRDQETVRFCTYDDLLDYCRLSAEPVGAMVLYLFGYRDEESHRLSRLVCRGLQLANFWQDVAIDLEKDRIYIPAEDLARFGCRLEELGQAKATREFRSLIAFEVARARLLFKEGWALTECTRGRLRYELKAIILGGVAILDLIERSDYNVLSNRPQLPRWRKAMLPVQALLPGMGTLR